MSAREDETGHDERAGPGALRLLFPAAPAPAAPRGVPGPGGGPGSGAGTGRRGGVVAGHAAALAAGAAVLLARVPGQPAWDTIYHEDLSVYLPDALARPWHLLLPYAGYVQPAPRLIAQLAAVLPLRMASVVFALAGALTAAACAIVVFHASAGHIRSAGLRALAGASVLFLPVATLEIADSTVDTVWYLLLALFWAVLWRPRSRAGRVTAAAVAFLTASAQPLALLFAPLFAARAIVLRRPRDHAVTAGWLAGLAVQLLPLLVLPRAADQSGSRAGQAGPAGGILSFYAHGVAQSAFGWHIGLWLQAAAGRDGAAAVAGLVLAVLAGWALLTLPAGARAFLTAALATGFAFTAASAGLGYRWASLWTEPSLSQERGARYTTLAIFLADCAAIVAVDALRRRRPADRPAGPRPGRPRAGPRPGQWRPGKWRPGRLVPVLALVAVLAAGWASDFRFATPRSDAPRWAPLAASWQDWCARNPAGAIRLRDFTREMKVIPCGRVRD